MSEVHLPIAIILTLIKDDPPLFVLMVGRPFQLSQMSSSWMVQDLHLCLIGQFIL